MSDLDTAAPLSSVVGLLREISDVGRDPVRGGYSRPVHSAAEHDLRTWFVDHATRRGLDVSTDRNGVIWAWLDNETGDRTDAVVTGSHLDSVPGGGQFDGPLGVASALVAVDRLRHAPSRTRAIAIAVFPEEEGSRFGVACLGSRLMTGDLDPDVARNLKDADGVTFAEAATAKGLDPHYLGRDETVLGSIGSFIELHVEQGRDLVDRNRAVALGRSIVSHGRWRLRVTGHGNHAGTTLMADRADPMVAAARIVVEVKAAASAVPGARATVGRLNATPGGTNVIASTVDLWLDARHALDDVAAALVADVARRSQDVAAMEGCTVEIFEESLSPTANFDPTLLASMSDLLPDAPILDTGAGHDAGVLAAAVPTGMLFVRNPTGVSHSPEEHVEDEDAEIGARVLATVIADLSTRSPLRR